MADLESLEIRSITDLSTDEAIEMLRQIRLGRRTPVKTTKTITASIRKQPIPKVSDDQAAELLKLIQGG